MVENFIIKHKDFLEIFFSFLTLLATVYTAFAAKKIGEKTNEISKNSLRPYLDIILGKYEEKTYIKITNNGLGTAIIKEIQIKYREETFDSILELLEKHFSPRIVKGTNVDFYSKGSFSTYVEDLKNRSVAPQDSIILLEKRHDIDCGNIDLMIQFEAKKLSHKTKLLNLLSEVTIIIKYTDIFEERKKYFCVSKKLDFFK